MYRVKRSGSKLPQVLKNVFSTYNEARSALRKWLRQQKRICRDNVEMSNRTVNIGKYGFSITKV